MKILILDIDYTLNTDDPRPLIELATRRGHHKYSKAVWNLFREPAEDMSVPPHAIPYKHYDEFIKNYDKVIIITSRLEDWKKPTKRWLRKWGFTYDHLYMRPSGTFRIESYEIKREFIEKIKDKWPEAKLTAIDDDKGVIEYYRSEGIKVFVAPEEWERALTYHRRMNNRIEKKKTPNLKLVKGK
jgi:hypothetical protein